MKKIGRDIQHYTPLIAILGLGLLGFYIFSYDRQFQSIIVIATAAGYVSWGIVHHYIHRDLHTSVIFEYLALGIVGVIVVLSLIANA